MEGYLVSVEIAAMEGDRVMVKNPRSKNDLWEPGVATGVQAGIHRNGKNGSSYDVMLDRQLPQFDKWGRERYRRGIRVSVGRSSVQLISKSKEAPDGR